MPTTSVEWAQWVEAIGTMIAVIAALGIALFQDKMRAWIMRPKLDVSISPKPPDCVKIPTVRVVEPIAEGDAYYLRARVVNKGDQRATDVEVYAAKLLKRQADGSFKEIEDFLPMNLTWAHRNDVVLPGISPKMYRHCGIACVFDPKKRQGFPLQDIQWPNVSPEKTILSLNTEVKSNNKSYLLPFGAYRLVIEVTAANATPVEKTLEITLTGAWYEDEREMLSQGIGVKVLQ